MPPAAAGVQPWISLGARSKRSEASISPASRIVVRGTPEYTFSVCCTFDRSVRSLTCSPTSILVILVMTIIAGMVSSCANPKESSPVFSGMRKDRMIVLVLVGLMDNVSISVCIYIWVEVHFLAALPAYNTFDWSGWLATISLVAALEFTRACHVVSSSS